MRVDSVKVARKLMVKGTLGAAEEKTTQGVWVVVQATATATKEEVGLGDVGLRSRGGRFYAASDRIRGLHDSGLEAGIPRSGPIAFELPPDELPGAVLSISGAKYAQSWRIVGALGPAIEIDLGLGTATPAGELTVTEAEL